MTRRILLSTIGAAMLAFAPGARAAGGHFDVDDSTMLAPARCQAEAWLARSPAAGATLWHIAPACRLGPVELGLAIDRLAAVGERRTLVGPQLKWVTDPALGPVSAGFVAAAFVDTVRGGGTAWTLYAPLTWNVDATFALNLNLGVDRDAAGRHSRRQGVGGEWALSERVTVLAERIRLGGEWLSRLGARYAVTDALSVDLNAARLGPASTRVVVFGLNHEFAR